jgi:hypothetical protein
MNNKKKKKERKVQLFRLEELQKITATVSLPFSPAHRRE